MRLTNSRLQTEGPALGERNTSTFDEQIELIAREIVDLVISKQKDYGTKNILGCPVGPEIGIVVRLHDKMSRLSNLIGNKEPKNESIEDTWKDIVGYALIALMVRRGVFDYPLREAE